MDEFDESKHPRDDAGKFSISAGTIKRLAKPRFEGIARFRKFNKGVKRDAGLQKPIRIGNGEYGGFVAHNSARNPGVIQVTQFLEDGTPAGHTEHKTIGDALLHHIVDLDHPVSKLLKGNQIGFINAWEEATFESHNKSELVKKPFAYVSPLRPLSGVMVDGLKSANKNGKMGVLYRDNPISIGKMDSLSLVPITKQAKLDFVEQYAKSKKNT